MGNDDLSYKILKVLKVTLPFTASHLQIMCIQYFWEGGCQRFLLLGQYDPAVFREIMQEHTMKFQH